MLTLTYYRRHVYGEVLTYLAGGKAADHVRALTGRKTVTRCDRQALEGLGFTFVEVSAFTSEGGSK